MLFFSIASVVVHTLLQILRSISSKSKYQTYQDYSISSHHPEKEFNCFHYLWSFIILIICVVLLSSVSIFPSNDSYN